mgnify:CR=1 FL=1
METIRLHKGLDLHLAGEAQKKVLQTLEPDTVSVRPSDYRSMVPKLLVAEGDAVLAGQLVFLDKKRPQIGFASPVSGTVKAIVRGEKRKLLSVEIAADKETRYAQFEKLSIAKASRQEIQKVLLESGLWAGIIQRPYGIIANPEDTPKAIVVSAFNSAPLAADINFTLKNDADAMQIAVDALAKFTTGKVYVNLSYNNGNGSPLNLLRNVEKTMFKGPHPAGNVGVQINHLCPIGKGETVWTVQPQILAAMGRLFSKGIYDVTRLVAITGPRAVETGYVRCVPGVAMKDLKAVAGVVENMDIYGQPTGVRYVSGNPLSGENVGEGGSLGFYDDTVTFLSEGNYRELFGWAKPFRMKKFSSSRTYFSWLCPKKQYKADTNVNGGERAFIVSDVYGKVLPMDIYPVYLLKAILAEDIEKMEQFGIYEVIGEDFALCEYVDPSKIEIQKIIDKGIDLMLKEMA